MCAYHVPVEFLAYVHAHTSLQVMHASTALSSAASMRLYAALHSVFL